MKQKFLLSLLLVVMYVATQAQSLSGIVNVYSKVLYVDVNRGYVKLADVSGYGQYIGRKVMIIQMKGATIASSNDNTFGNITAMNNAGAYEINTVCGFLNDTMVLRRKLTHAYEVTGAVQLIIMPQVTDGIVTDTIKAKPWSDIDGTGGVVALDMSGSLTLNKPIDVSGAGFKGGDCLKFTTCLFTNGDANFSYTTNTSAIANGALKGSGIAATIVSKEAGRGKQANGGGGGNNHNAGGGGGANVGAGGRGGDKTNGSCRSNTAGIAGASLSGFGYSNANNKIFMGGGGGSGHDNDGYGMSGGHGGGIVFIRANNIIGNSSTAGDNKIIANGLTGSRFIAAPGANAVYNYSWSDGAGGAGAGGAIVLHVNTFSGNNITAEANGGKGSNSEGVGNNNCSGPGGGGGGGAIWLKAADAPLGLTTTVAAGTNGIVQFSANGTCNGAANSATAGGIGAVFFSHVMPLLTDTTATCAGILQSVVSVNLSGSRQMGNYLLSAQLLVPIPVQTMVLQKSNSAGGPFVDIETLGNNNSFVYNYSNPVAKRATVYYRAKLVQPNNTIVYSNIIALRDSTSEQLLLQLLPNPIAFNGVLRITAPETEQAQIIIFDSKGALVHQQTASIQFGINDVNLFLPNLQLGHYILKVVTPSAMGTLQFVKATVY